MLSLLWTLAAFVVTLGILVTIHEFGHYWVARRCGVKVLTFSVGFGKALWSRQAQDGTVYQVGVIPWVAMYGCWTRESMKSVRRSTR